MVLSQNTQTLIPANINEFTMFTVVGELTTHSACSVLKFILYSDIVWTNIRGLN